jgi:hypothetical protein
MIGITTGYALSEGWTIETAQLGVLRKGFSKRRKRGRNTIGLLSQGKRADFFGEQFRSQRVQSRCYVNHDDSSVPFR